MALKATTVSNVFPSRRVKDRLYFVGKSYVPEKGDPDGITAVFFHCAGSHKEAWEPTIAYLFSQTFDFQSHGEASLLNKEKLKPFENGIPVDEYADGFKAFVTSGALSGHRLVGIGHSLGTSAVVLSTIADEVQGVNFEAIVLEAKAYFEQRFPWSTWDRRIRELFFRHGLKEISVQDEDGHTATKITLTCQKDHERSAYSQDEVYFDYVLQGVIDVRPAASVQRVPESGHFVLEEKPEGLGQAIAQILIGISQNAPRANL
ncbi:hypothetical protein BD414DRAFT_511995 [Trametes punicea]|nr:hypothetical protein BD414DRAFT_511995 [Trametes punicea]